MRKLDYPELDEAMNKWYEKAIKTPNTTIDGPAMKRQAGKFSSMLGFNNFKTSDGLLQKFKQRHNIVFKVLTGEAGLVNAFIVKYWNKRLIGYFKIPISFTNRMLYIKKNEYLGLI